MKRFLFLIFIFVFCCDPKSPEEVLEKVDEKIYYPNEEGLTSLSCDVESPYLGEVLEKWRKGLPELGNIFAELNPEVHFYWQKGEKAFYRVIGIPEDPPAIRQSIELIFKGTEILVIPPTERENFKPFKTEMKKDKQKFTIFGTNPDPSAMFRQYNLVVERGTYKILEKVYFGNGFTSRTHLKFLSVDKKALLTKIETSKDSENDSDFASEVNVEYEQLKGFWIVKSFNYSFKNLETNEVVGPVEVRFSGCKVNEPLPEGIYSSLKPLDSSTSK